MASAGATTGLNDCVFCGASGVEFGPFGLDLPVFAHNDVVGGGLRPAARCPDCGSFDRERLVYLYIKNRTDLLRAGGDQRVLHVAPEVRIRPRLRAALGAGYVAGDLNPTDGLVRVDVTALEFPDATFDGVICNHVLEHVPDDLGAMRELRRVLKPGGWAMLQVPLAMGLERTYEDPSVTDPAERERVFGQNDHVRLYGRDYADRLRGAGFEVEVFDWTSAGEDFGGAGNRFGLIERERLHVARVPALTVCVPVRPRAGADSVLFEGNTVPAPHAGLGEPEFRDAALFMASARREADRLIERCGLKAWSSLLDIGCGPGRLAAGVIDRFCPQSGGGGLKWFQGVDVNAPAIDWCNRHLAPGRPWMRFRHTNVRNERYNPGGAPAGSVPGRVLPFGDGVFDVVNLYDVFSHMTMRDVAVHLKEVARLLSPKGRAFCTAYVEYNVDDCVENPRAYRGDHTGRLHRVRFSNTAFDRLVVQAGLKVDRFDHATELDGQTGIYLSRYLEKPPMPEGRKLEIGPGAERIEGFETLNIAPGPGVDHVADAAERLPFDDGTFSVVYASHVLEHVPWYLTERALREWARVLAPGGLLEVWVPDGLKIARAFVEAEDGLASGGGGGGEDRTIQDGWYRFNPDRDPCVWASGRTFTYGDGPPGTNYASPNWHRALFSARRLERAFRDAGLIEVERLDRSQVRADDHGWINLGFRGVKPDAGKAVGGTGQDLRA
jgi:ubiquinone/menaquinone biosynthesis C-methylase UbiE